VVAIIARSDSRNGAPASSTGSLPFKAEDLLPNGDSRVDRNLIFDLGLHHGYDTEFYLNKGFKVIALEANPLMVERARKNPAIHKAEEEGRLGIVPMALWHESGKPVSFFVNEIKDDWSSIDKSWAEKGSHASLEITVATITPSATWRERTEFSAGSS
jgi:FkbM family methyltransferase